MSTIMEGIKMEPRRGYSLVFPTSVIITHDTLDMDGWAIKDEDHWAYEHLMELLAPKGDDGSKRFWKHLNTLNRY